MSTLLTILHVIVCLFLMLTVLLQSGKGGGMGAAFGGGSAAPVFGGSGASSFLRRLTAGAATIFMLTSITLAWLSSRSSADALAKFGAQQDELSKQKDEAAQKALDAAAKNKGSGAGSGSAMGSGAPLTPLTPLTPPPAAGSASGSAATPDATKPDATKPAEKPPAGSAATKPD